MQKWVIALTATGLLMAVNARGDEWAKNPAAPPAPPATETADVRETVIPEIKLDNVPLGDAVDYFNQSVPGLQLMLVRASGSEAAATPLKLAAKNVSVAQLMILLQRSVPGLVVDEPVMGPRAVVFTMHVDPPKAGDRPDLFGRDGGVSDVPVVQLFRLSPTVDAQLNAHPDDDGKKTPAEVRKAALEDVLSVISTAMSQVPGSAPVLRMHDATETLIFNGTPRQRDIVKETLGVLVPDATENSGRQIADLQAAIESRSRKADQAELAMRQAQEKLTEMSIENERLRVRLEMQPSATTRASR